VLSVGSEALNKKEDAIDYLRKLKNNLQVLRIDNNKFQKSRNAEYKKYTIARLKQLKYIDYELIDQKDREAADAEHKDEIGQAEQNEGNDQNDEQHENLLQELRDAKIEISQDIFEKCLTKLDEDQEKLKSFLKYDDTKSMHTG